MVEKAKNTVDGAVSNIQHTDPSIKTVSALQSANRHTTEHTKTTLLTKLISPAAGRTIE